MGRLPFDPSKMRGVQPPAPDKPAPSAAEGVLTVSGLNALIRGAVEDHLPARVRVVGEVSGLRRSTHLYFALKDAGAVVSAAVFASNLRKLAFEPRDGQEVLATGRIEFYAAQGRVTLIVEKLDPVGQGAHELRFRQLCQELRELGWFAPERKRPLPSFPRKVAVVTSETGAALQDVLSTMAKRCPTVGVVVVPVRVQGDAAAEQVVRALEHLSERHEELGVDAVIVTRGGGSPEDLAAFNDREVARAIVECRVPVVAAIGHETDTTIAELVADERCATPTQAAVRLTPDRDALHRQLDALAGRFRTDLARTLRFERQRVASAARHPVLAHPNGAARLAAERLTRTHHRLASAMSTAAQGAQRRCERAQAGLDRLQPDRLLAAAKLSAATHRGRLDRAMATGLASRATGLHALGQRLEAVGPRAVLRRGYSCTLRPDGTVVSDAAELEVGERLTTHLANGSFQSDVAETSPASPGGRAPIKAPPGSPTPRAKPSIRKVRLSPDQLDLFGGGG